MLLVSYVQGDMGRVEYGSRSVCGRFWDRWGQGSAPSMENAGGLHVRTCSYTQPQA
jgi:hypothetical protein